MDVKKNEKIRTASLQNNRPYWEKGEAMLKQSPEIHFATQERCTLLWLIS